MIDADKRRPFLKKSDLLRDDNEPIEQIQIKDARFSKICLVYSVMILKVKKIEISTFNILAIGRLSWETLYLHLLHDT